MPALHLAPLAAQPVMRESGSQRGAGAPEDSLLSFNTEADVRAGVRADVRADWPANGPGDPPPSSLPSLTTLSLADRKLSAPLLAVALGVIGIALTFAVLEARRGPHGAASIAAGTTGMVDITSQPPGAGIAIDGQARGTTPLRVSLPVGAHTIDVASGRITRSLPITIGADAVLNQHIEFAAAPVVNTGQLEITSERPGANVAVDGKPQGVTPLTLDGVAAGEHHVTVSRDGITVERQVTIVSGALATVVANTPVAATAAGWVRLKAPIELQVFEAGRLLGTTAADHLVLPPGGHDLEVALPSIEFHSTVRVMVPSGKTVSVPIVLPEGTLSINAIPWAEVSIDGRVVGTTPLGNLSLPIGAHEVIWRHPQLGERRQTVAVRAATPVGVGMDLTK